MALRERVLSLAVCEGMFTMQKILAMAMPDQCAEKYKTWFQMTKYIKKFKACLASLASVV